MTVEGASIRRRRRSILRQALPLAIAAVALYFVFPSLVAVFGSWRRLVDLQPWWLLPMVLLEVASFASIWELQRICLRTRLWVPVATAHLASNAFSRIVPGGLAAGAAVQYPMLVDAGIPRGRVGSGIATSNVLTFATLLALPVLSLPAILAGLSIDAGLGRAAMLGAVGFVTMLAAAAVVVAFDRPLALVGRVTQAALNRARPRRPPTIDLADRLLQERDRSRAAVGARWWKAVLAALGWWLFDYGALLLALAAIGADPQPSLVLVAYAAGLALSMVPLTPGGVGFVEAGLTAFLALAGINAADAALATLAYRLVSYWLPIPIGAAAVVVHRRHHSVRAAATAGGGPAPPASRSP